MQKKLVFGIDENDDPKKCVDEITIEVYRFLEKKDVFESPVIKNPDAPATPAQLEVLRKHKIGFAEGITKSEASRLIKSSMEEK